VGLREQSGKICTRQYTGAQGEAVPRAGNKWRSGWHWVALELLWKCSGIFELVGNGLLELQKDASHQTPSSFSTAASPSQAASYSTYCHVDHSNASKAPPKSTAPPQSSVGRGNFHGRPKGKGRQQSTVLQSLDTFQPIPQPPVQGVTLKSPPNISWDADPTRSEKLVAWLVSHPADRHILFHDRAGNSSATPAISPNDKPSRRNKKDVQAAIANHIFEHDDVYAELYGVEIVLSLGV